ncbi:MAG: D-aminoacyl-tRNA deacylase [Planctomycetota bacterium]
MRLLIQRVSSASVTVQGSVVGEINRGLLILVGVGREDSEAEAAWLADKVANLRVFNDENGKMNRSLIDVGGSILSVSQFTLYGDCRKGRRPAFTDAAEPGLGKQLYERFNELLCEKEIIVETGVFAADMKVSLVNDGPVTFWLER